MSILIHFRREHGDVGHNLVTIRVVMHQLHVGPQAAFDYISRLYDKTAAQFLDEWERIPTHRGLLDLEVRTYCHGLANWVRANNTWNFEVRPYFLKFPSPFLKKKLHSERTLSREQWAGDPKKLGKFG